MPAQTDSISTYSLKDLILYFLRLGATGFGGPVALVGYMHRDLVERRQWISESDYKEGLALAQLAPGPLAAQLAIYLGYVHYGISGATLAGIAFVIPSFLMVVALGWAYKHYGGLSWMQAVFYTVGASVIGIIAHSALKLTQKTIGKDRLLWVIYFASGLVTALTESEWILLFLGAGVLAWWVKSPPKIFKKIFSSTAAVSFPFYSFFWGEPSASRETLWNILAFFTKAGAFVFGSGLAVVPFLYSGVVKDYQWLNVQQFLDAVAVAMITPGPVVITVGFIGFLVAGFSGAALAALGTFLPCYFFTILPAPYFKKYGKKPALAAFVAGVTAAAIGAIAGAVVVLGRRSVTDGPTAIVFLASFLILWKVKKIPEPLLILVSGILGFFLYPLLHGPSR